MRVVGASVDGKESSLKATTEDFDEVEFDHLVCRNIWFQFSFLLRKRRPNATNLPRLYREWLYTGIKFLGQCVEAAPISQILTKLPHERSKIDLSR
jgi:hypothetical protein